MNEIAQNAPALNTDRELYREDTGDPAGSYYENSLHVTADGRIGMNVGGRVVVMPIADWHALATRPVAMEQVIPPESDQKVEVLAGRIQAVIDWFETVPAKARAGMTNELRGHYVEAADWRVIRSELQQIARRVRALPPGGEAHG